MVKDKVAKMLNEQINLELFSSYLYLEMANYFIDEGLNGFGNWFNVQVQEEMDHARLIMDYLQENDISIQLDKLDNPSRDYKKHMEVLEEVLSHEQDITAAIHDIYEVAMEEKDFRTMKFLGWFIEEQGEEEANATELISKYELFGEDKKGLYMLDQELGQRVHVAPDIAAE